MVTSADIERLRTIVAQRLGLVFDEAASDHLAGVLRQELDRTASRSAADYFQRLLGAASGAGDLMELANALTVGETYFFRHPAQLNAFAEVALPRRLAERDGQPVRILSAGCATGEEPYSLAIIVAEALAGKRCPEVLIMGIDVSPLALKRAVAARYSEWSLRATSHEQRQRYLRLEGRDYVLVDAIRSRVAFQVRNVLEDDPGFWRHGQFDIIFFRNVTIYFAPATAKAVIARMSQSLAPGGYLFLGPSETLRGVSNDFHLLHTHDAFYYQRRRPEEMIAPARGAGATTPLPAEPPRSADAVPGGSWVEAIGRATARVAAATQRRRSVLVPQAQSRPDREPGERRRGHSHLEAAQELVRQERFDEAMAALRALPAGSAADAEMLLLRAALLTNRGSITEAQEVCRQILQIDELNAGAHYLLALCQEHAGAPHTAVEHDQTAIYLDPAFAMPHLHLGMMTKRRGDFTTARSALQRALTLLEQEHPSRILLFGGGFSREALLQLCRTELRTCGGAS